MLLPTAMRLPDDLCQLGEKVEPIPDLDRAFKDGLHARIRRDAFEAGDHQIDGTVLPPAPDLLKGELGRFVDARFVDPALDGTELVPWKVWAQVGGIKPTPAPSLWIGPEVADVREQWQRMLSEFR